MEGLGRSIRGRNKQVANVTKQVLICLETSCSHHPSSGAGSRWRQGSVTCFLNLLPLTTAWSCLLWSWDASLIIRVAQEDTRNKQIGPSRSRIGAYILRSWRCRIQDPGDSGASSRHGYGRKEAGPGPALGWAPYGLVPIGQQYLPRVPYKRVTGMKGQKGGILGGGAKGTSVVRRG